MFSAAMAVCFAARADTDCALFAPGANQATAGDCMSCHALARTHAVDFDYATAAAQRPDFFRSASEVVQRGVFLPGGKVVCVTCHDPASPWKDKIALPPGTQAIAGVNLAVPASYEKRTTTPPPPPAGSSVTPTPLCKACHTLAD